MRVPQHRLRVALTGTSGIPTEPAEVWERRTAMSLRKLRYAAFGLILCGALSTCSAESDSTSPVQPLTADFTYEVEVETVNVTSCPATAVSLRDRSEGGPTRWRWDVPGRPTSSDQNPVISPPISPGDTVTLRIWRGNETDEVTKVVNYPEC